MTDIDDFDFRPLTEGLGFQKKSPTPLLKPSSPSSESFDSKSLDSSLHSFFGPERELPNPPAKTPQPDTAVDEILKSLKKNNLDFFTDDSTQKKQSHAFPKSPSPQWTVSTNSLMALFLDGLLILAICLTAMIVLILVIDVDLMAILRGKNDLSLMASHLSIFAGFSIIYLLSSRCYLGATPGEWAFDQQLGNPAEQKTPIYPLKVFVRSILVVFSGFIVFPILSWLLGYDLAGKISDVRLMERRK